MIFIISIHNLRCRLLQLSPMKIILIGYCTIILIGTLLLGLPIATRNPEDANFFTGFFTATSATCVTGLIQFDTYTYWSPFGQAVILGLIQIGGIGFMTLGIFIMVLAKVKIGLISRSLMQNSVSAPQIGGIVKMTRFILRGTFSIELFGAILLAIYFCPKYGLGKGIWFSVFHSISAFCNAGFDLMGTAEPFSSLTAQVGNWYVNLIIMSLIVVGGLGFFVWRDILNTRLHFTKMQLHTKLVLTVTAFLIISGSVLLLLFEHGTASFEGLTLSEQVAAASFQSVSARTAGFNTIDLAALTESGRVFDHYPDVHRRITGIHRRRNQDDNVCRTGAFRCHHIPQQKVRRSFRTTVGRNDHPESNVYFYALPFAFPFRQHDHRKDRKHRVSRRVV